MKSLLRASIGIACTILFTSCFATKTVLSYQHLNGNDLKNGQVYEAESKPFDLLVRFRIIVAFHNDSVHVAIYGGNGHHKGGTHFIRESDKINRVVHYYLGSAKESSNEYIARTSSAFVFKRKEKLYIRFNVIGYHKEYQTEIKLTNLPFSSAFNAYQKWAMENKVSL